MVIHATFYNISVICWNW